MESRLHSESKRTMLTWDISESVARNGRNLILCHGSPYSFNDQLTEENSEVFEERILKENVDYVFCGHTHQQARFKIHDTQIINR